MGIKSSAWMFYLANFVGYSMMLQNDNYHWFVHPSRCSESTFLETLDTDQIDLELRWKMLDPNRYFFLCTERANAGGVECHELLLQPCCTFLVWSRWHWSDKNVDSARCKHDHTHTASITHTQQESHTRTASITRKHTDTHPYIPTLNNIALTKTLTQAETGHNNWIVSRLFLLEVKELLIKKL